MPKRANTGTPPKGRIEQLVDHVRMALPTQFSTLILGPTQTFAFSGEDLVSSFYLCALPRSWAGWFTFEREIPGELVGRPGTRVRIGATVHRLTEAGGDKQI